MFCTYHSPKKPNINRHSFRLIAGYPLISQTRVPNLFKSMAPTTSPIIFTVLILLTARILAIPLSHTPTTTTKTLFDRGNPHCPSIECGNDDSICVHYGCGPCVFQTSGSSGAAPGKYCTFGTATEPSASAEPSETPSDSDNGGNDSDGGGSMSVGAGSNQSLPDTGSDSGSDDDHGGNANGNANGHANGNANGHGNGNGNASGSGSDTCDAGEQPASNGQCPVNGGGNSSGGSTLNGKPSTSTWGSFWGQLLSGGSTGGP